MIFPTTIFPISEDGERSQGPTGGAYASFKKIILLTYLDRIRFS